ncbi:MAG: methylenetetrahydrofolate reductase [Caldimonas sp.]
MNAEIDRDALSREIVRLMRDYSIEQTPAELLRRAALPAELPAGSRVFLTWVAGSPFDQMRRAAVRLRELGMTPVPHLAARAIADTATLDRMLTDLARDASVDHALLIAGSQRTLAGRFDSALAALTTGRFEQHGWRALGMAAHPEGSPDIEASALASALREKNAYDRATTMKLHLVTQFSFAGAPVVAWERRVRGDGNGLPVHVGVAGLASLATLLRYARVCGVGASIAALGRQAGRVLKLASAVLPGEIVVAVAQARLADPDSCFRSVHFFPFGSLDATVAWASTVARGDFRLSDDGTDLAV